MTGIMQMVLPSRTITPPNFISTLATTFLTGVARDSSGNVYTVGFVNSADQAFITAKYDSLGVLQWQRTLDIPGTTGDLGLGIATDSSGNVYVCGASNSSSAFQIAKYSTSGVIQWQRNLTGTGPSKVLYGVTVNSSGDVYTTGQVSVSGVGVSMYLIKYNTSGVIQYQRKLDGGGQEQGRSVALDSSGNVYNVGTLIFANFSVSINKFNSSGVLQWQRRLRDTSGSTGAFGYGAAVDSSSNVYLTGGNNGVVLIGKYNSSGTFQWLRQLGGSGNCIGYGVTTDSSGNVYVCGWTSSNFFIIAKYNTSGVIQWQRSLTGSSGSSSSYGIVLDATGSNYYVSGSNGVLIKFPTDGSKTGTYTVGSTTFTYAASTLTDAASPLSDQLATLTDSAGVLTDAASSLTDAASSFTSTTTNF